MPALAEGAMKQQRLLVVAPKEAGEEDLARILRRRCSPAANCGWVGERASAAGGECWITRSWRE